MAERGFTFAEAKEALWPTNIFTTHTPVPAGNERFGIDLMEKYFRSWAQDLGLPWNEFLALGREHPEDDRETFCMTILALRLSAYSNGVARLHGQVSREMWMGLWPGLPVSEIPIGHITNGVHPRTWVSSNMVDLLDRYFGLHFDEQPTDLSVWDRMDRISDEELWRTHERRRERLVAFARDRIRRQLKRNGATESRIQQAEDALSPYTFTIAFARRFATYKRANLLLRDPERLLRLLRDSEHPIQLIFAGKAHPHDMPGKDIIREIVHFAEKYDVVSKIVFLEDYDMTMAKYMTSGSDLWLNTPRRPLEASGTSGMKAAMNGVLNCSVLDGWWDEAYAPELGWAIGQGEQYEDTNLQDEIESKALYDLLEREIVPLFYQRGRDGLPREWIKRMKSCMRTIGQSMSSHRMLIDYSQKFYFPALKNYKRLVKDGFAESKDLAAYLAKLRGAWSQVGVLSIESNAKPIMQRGDSLTVTACINLGSLAPEEVRVELYHGSVSNQGDLENARRTEMHPVAQQGDCYKFQVRIDCADTGRQGHTVRILPNHPALVHPYVPGLIKWA
jgi:starch phosphorylase